MTMETETTPESEPRKGRVLVVDDDADGREALALLLADEGYSVETAEDGERGLEQVATFGPDVVVTDVNMPGMDGLELLRRARDEDPHLGVVVMTAFGNVRDAVEAMRRGAQHYVTKPVDPDEITLTVAAAIERRRLVREAGWLRERLRGQRRFENLVGDSPRMQALFKAIHQVAPSRATVLITGESGTGKERVAEAIHESSPRAGKPFVKLHCAALVESLLESELFGHEKGAFTGATRRRDGRFEAADGGTLFLDEISEITPSTQVKLLRVLQERTFERVGGNEPIKVDVRIVAATNRDLRELVSQGKFREDLYYRLNVVTLALPPLRERKSDILLLAERFLRRFAQEAARPLQGFSPAAMTAMMHHAWPGNVRELENAIERAVVMADGPTIEVHHLSSNITGIEPDEVAKPEGDMDAPAAPKIPGATLAEVERHAILTTLAAAGGSTKRAAEMLGVSIRMVQYRLREWRDGPGAAGNAPEDDPS
ncbi:MAG: sigma-54-dependent Fis family transcriptional regulator [Deltaproteobacteria bacterium]|nr:sigma-54-dependent Fis family transcriptional regulator [Deltaproteobacteria bacterium]